MLELVPDSAAQLPSCGAQETQQTERPSAMIHYIYDPFNPSQDAIVSVARRLQEVLIEHGALPESGELPFPALAPAGYK